MTELDVSLASAEKKIRRIKILEKARTHYLRISDEQLVKEIKEIPESWVRDEMLRLCQVIAASTGLIEDRDKEIDRLLKRNQALRVQMKDLQLSLETERRKQKGGCEGTPRRHDDDDQRPL